MRLDLWRLGLMIPVVMAPELIVFLAARQCLFTRAFAKEFELSRQHAFFFAMGGFVSRGVYLHPITTREQLEDPKYLADIRGISAEAILDESKGDGLPKAVELLQGF
ncbi:hypothetical protein FB451DRAFT_1565545 [Mycena latifolia]|nr:hypothetical protein FB451DRAFT_1565545 [Mycena latifolia]